jgi:hypothetical protein
MAASFLHNVKEVATDLYKLLKRTQDLMLIKIKNMMTTFLRDLVIK